MSLFLQAGRVALLLCAVGLSACVVASGTPRVAQVDPSCVEPGGIAELTVNTEPGAPVLYTTTYGDGEKGAPAPFGKGYGGNDGGFADPNGTYQSEWTVSEDAPSGTVIVRIVLPGPGHDHSGSDSDQDHAPSETPHGSGELEAQFEVAGPVGGC